MIIPQFIFLTKGIGVHEDHLMSFELALRDAGIEGCNLVPVSSIFPPHCTVITKEEGLKKLKPGAITFCVWGRIDTNNPGTTISACTAAAIPNDPTIHGYLAEHTSTSLDQQTTQVYTEKLATTMFRSRYGHDEYNHQSIALERKHEEKGQWSTIIATAVLLE